MIILEIFLQTSLPVARISFLPLPRFSWEDPSTFLFFKKQDRSGYIPRIGKIGVCSEGPLAGS